MQRVQAMTRTRNTIQTAVQLPLDNSALGVTHGYRKTEVAENVLKTQSLGPLEVDGHCAW